MLSWSAVEGGSVGARASPHGAPSTLFGATRRHNRDCHTPRRPSGQKKARRPDDPSRKCCRPRIRRIFSMFSCARWLEVRVAERRRKALNPPPRSHMPSGTGIRRSLHVQPVAYITRRCALPVAWGARGYHQAGAKASSLPTAHGRRSFVGAERHARTAVARGVTGGRPVRPTIARAAGDSSAARPAAATAATLGWAAREAIALLATKKSAGGPAPTVFVNLRSSTPKSPRIPATRTRRPAGGKQVGIRGKSVRR